MIRLGGGNRRSLGRRNYLPYQLVRQFQRDFVIGLGMIVSCGILLLIIGAATEPFSVRILEDGPRYVAQMNDGTECQLFETRPINDPSLDARAMVDCGIRPGLGVVGAFQYVFMAVLGVGVLLAVTGGLALLLSSRVSRDMVVLPIAVLGIIVGIVSIAWGLSGDAPGLVFQGLRDQATTGLLRTGGALTNKDGAAAWGVGLVAASTLRLARL